MTDKTTSATDNSAAPTTTRFSLVIPAYNEADYLPALLDTVDAARKAFRDGGPDAIEVIVANNNSTDRTADIARDRGCRVVDEEQRIIAAVRNAGGHAATGEFLCFVDADSTIHPDTFNVICDAIQRPDCVAGATGVHLERMSPGIAAAYCLMIPVVWCTGMDTGVVFCRRSDFLAIDGYNTRRRFAEDVDFLWRLRALGKTRNQKLVRVRGVKATTSTRKFDQHGDWHYVKMIARVCCWTLVGPERLERLAENYWYGNQRPPRTP